MFAMTMRKQLSRRGVRTAAAGSWLALLAGTTFGDAANTLRAEVRADGLSDADNYRLVVQSYDAADGPIPGRHSRPIGSMQRAVTAEELRLGVRVNLLELRPGVSDANGVRPMVVAWVEAGEPDLEFDGRTARPQPGDVYGVVKRDARQAAVRISLNRKVAA
jgi:hypothetical protein